MVANCSQRVGCGKSSANIAINNFSHFRCLWCSHNKRWSLFPLPWIWNSLVTCLAQWSIAVLWLFSSGFKQIGNWHSLWELWTPTQEVQLFCWRDMRRRVEVVVSSVHSVWVPGWKQPGDYSSWPLHEPRSIQRSMKNLKRKLNYFFWFKSYGIHLYWYVANYYKLRGLNIYLVFLFPGSGVRSWPCWVLCRGSHKATIKVSDHPSLDQ